MMPKLNDLMSFTYQKTDPQFMTKYMDFTMYSSFRHTLEDLLVLRTTKQEQSTSLQWMQGLTVVFWSYGPHLPVQLSWGSATGSQMRTSRQLGNCCHRFCPFCSTCEKLDPKFMTKLHDLTSFTYEKLAINFNAL